MSEASDEYPVSETGNGISAGEWLKAEALTVRGRLLAVVGLTLVTGLLIVMQCRLLATACHRLVIRGTGSASIMDLAGFLVIVAAVRGVLSYVTERQVASVVAQVKKSVRSRLYRRLQDLGPGGKPGEGTGQLVELVTTGIDELEPYFGRFLPQLVLAALLPVMFLAVIFPAEWRTGLVLLLSAPFIPLFMVLIGRGAERLSRRQWGHLATMSAHLLDLVQGLPDLIMCGAAKREAAMVARVSDEYRQSTMAVLRLAFLSAFALEFFATVGTAVVAVIVGFRLLGGNLPFRDGLFVLLMAPEFYQPLRTLGGSFHARMQGVAAAERIVALLAKASNSSCGGTLQVSAGAPSVIFEDVSCRFAGERGGIRNVTLEFPAGSMTALTGESGAGKTTLARLMTGLAVPDSGRILVNGQDLSTLAPDAWRARLAWVSQTPFFFAGTIRENLLLGRQDATEWDIAVALEAASATQFVERLPLGVDTVLGDRGAGLSGGELRRLALARAFIRKADLLVLDEPTAGLDPESERLVGEAVQRFAGDHTVLVISHREQVLAMADRVAELSAGRIERVVTPREFFYGWASP